MRRTGMLIGLLIFSGLASAEMRSWEDKQGHRFKAEFVQELFGDIMLREPGGHTRLIKLDDLSAKDHAYLFQRASPKIEINFVKTTRKRPEMEWTIPEDVTTLCTCTVRINKTSELPYKGKLTAELFVLATEVDGKNYILIHREKSEFTFPDGRRSQYEFQAENVQFRRYNASWAATASRYRGAEYFGCLIAVSDEQGRVISSKTDIKDADWVTANIQESVEGLRKIAINGRGSVYSRHFNNRFEKVMVPRIPWHKRDAWF